MAVETVRVIRTWDVDVTAEYGDTPETLAAKVTDEYLNATTPSAEDRHVLPDYSKIVPQADWVEQ